MYKFHRAITLERLEKFTSQTHFADVNLQAALYGRRSQAAVQLRAYAVPDLKRMYAPFLLLSSIPIVADISHDVNISSPFAEAARPDNLPYRPAKVGDVFGPAWATHWFLMEIHVPSDWAGEQVALIWDGDNEGLLWSEGPLVVDIMLI